MASAREISLYAAAKARHALFLRADGFLLREIGIRFRVGKERARQLVHRGIRQAGGKWINGKDKAWLVEAARRETHG